MEIDVAAFTVVRDFEQIDDAEESRLSRQTWGNIWKAESQTYGKKKCNPTPGTSS